MKMWGQAVCLRGDSRRGCWRERMREQRGEGNACLPGQVTSVGSRSPVLLETLGDSAEHARRHSPPKERDSWGFCAPTHAVPIQGLFQGCYVYSSSRWAGGSGSGCRWPRNQECTWRDEQGTGKDHRLQGPLTHSQVFGMLGTEFCLTTSRPLSATESGWWRRTSWGPPGSQFPESWLGSSSGSHPSLRLAPPPWPEGQGQGGARAPRCQAGGLRLSPDQSWLECWHGDEKRATLLALNI